jgi:putative membrane protein
VVATVRPSSSSPNASTRQRLTTLPGSPDTPLVRRDPAGLELFASLLVGWGVNVLTLMIVDSLFDSVTIGRWGSLLLGAAVLGIANAIVKPVLTVLALPLIVATFGIAYFAINVGMLALAEWVAPNFSIDGFWTYVGATIMVWLVNWIISAAIGMFFGRRSGGPVARLQY